MASAGRVAGLKIELEIDGSKATKYLSTSQKQVDKMQKSLKDLEKSLKLNPTNATLLEQKFRLLGDSVSKTRDYLADLKNHYERLSSISDPTAKQREQMDNLEREISDTEKALQSLSAQLQAFGSVGSQQIMAAGQQMKEFGDKVQSIGSSITSSGMAVSRLSAPLAGAFGVAVKDSVAFEQAMADVQSIMRANDDDLQSMSDYALEWAKNTVYSADEVAGAYYNMGLAGLKPAEATKSLVPVLDLAAASNLEVARTSEILVDTIIATGGSFDEASRYANVFAATMSNSDTTTEKLGETFKYVSQWGGAAQFSVEDLALATGLFAQVGVKGSQAGTGLRMALSNMVDPAHADRLRQYGVDLFDINGKARPLRDVLEELRATFGGVNLELVDAEGNLKDAEQLMEEYGDSLPLTQQEKLEAIIAVFGKRALPGMLGLISASEEEFNELADAIDNSGDSMVRIDGKIMKLKDAQELYGKELENATGNIERLSTTEAMRETRLATTQGQLIKLKDNLSVLGIELLSGVLPAINKFLVFLTGLVEKFRSLSPGTKKFILIIGGLVAALGPVLVAVGQLVFGIGGLISVGGSLVTAFGAVSAFFTGTLGPAIASVFGMIAANPIVLAIAGIAAAAAFIITYWDEIVAAAKEIWNSLVEFFSGLWEGIKWMFSDVWNSIKEKVVEIWTNIKEKISETISNIKENLERKWFEIKKAIWEKLKAILWDIVEKWNEIKSNITEKIENIKNTLSEKWEAIKTKIREVVENIKNKVVETWENIKTKISEVVESIKEKVSNIWENIKETTKSVWETIKGLITKPIEDAKETVSNLIETIKGFFPISLSNIFSNFKMPHLSWYWEDVGGILKIPKFSVDWYAKAMNNGMLLDGATIFGMNRNGQPMGGGEAGREWIVGENGLMSMIRGAVSQQQLSPDVIYSAVVRGMHDANITVYMDGKKVTDQVGRQAAISADSQRRYFGAR